jgi:thioredoxin reductase
MNTDAIVVGGSFAGLAAATQIARARRNVLVVDAGLRRNRFADASHGFLGQDGRAPGDIIADARRQLLAYPTVRIVEDTAISARATDAGFAVKLANGGEIEATRLVLATGVTDTLPEVPGLRERWGRSVFHCPYCHGYEIGRGRISVLGIGPMSIHQAMLIAEWGETTLLTNGMFEPDAGQATELAERGVKVETQAVLVISGNADVTLADGRKLSFDGMFTASLTSMASPLAEQLGCKFVDGPLGKYIETSGFMRTSVPGVFACGDAARGAGSVSIAVGDGAMAGVGAHQSMVFPQAA